MSSRLLDQSHKIFAGMIVFSWVICRPGFISASEQLRFKPGFNLFSPKADVQLGRESSADADKKLPLVSDPELVRYVNDLGKRLAQFAPVNSDYPWTFKVVNSKEINAFALPGGFIYVNRGALEAAENEAQIAGVMAHEIGHVVMRHGTHQASQALLTTAPLMILGGALQQSSGLMGRLAELGIRHRQDCEVHRGNPGEKRDAVAPAEVLDAGADLLDDARRLVAHHERRNAAAARAVVAMDVAAADAARAHAHQDVIRMNLRHRHVRDRQLAVFSQQQRLQKPRPFAFRRTRIRYMSAVM